MCSSKLLCHFSSSPWLFFQLLLDSFLLSLQDWGFGSLGGGKSGRLPVSRSSSSFHPSCSPPSLIHGLSLVLLLHSGHSTIAHYFAAKSPLYYLWKVVEIRGGPQLLEKYKSLARLQKSPKRQSRELNAGQPHLCPWENHRVLLKPVSAQRKNK